jgi:hypothetical protein
LRDLRNAEHYKIWGFKLLSSNGFPHHKYFWDFLDTLLEPPRSAQSRLIPY